MNSELPAICFAGFREAGLTHVSMNGQPFTAARSLLLRKHSPTGFEWGFAGSGPAQLALALLLEVTSEEAALMLYQSFKFDVVVKLNESWILADTDILAWLNSQATT